MNSQIQNKNHAEQTGENTCKVIRIHSSYEQHFSPLIPPYFIEHVVWKERPENGHLLAETEDVLFNFYAATTGIHDKHCHQGQWLLVQRLLVPQTSTVCTEERAIADPLLPVLIRKS